MNDVNPRIRIVADDRERSSAVRAALGTFDDVDLEIRRLPVADFLVADQFAVERKTLADFARSVIDARLFRQTAALAAGWPRALIILEGTAADLDGVAISRESFQGALITVSVF